MTAGRVVKSCSYLGCGARAVPGTNRCPRHPKRKQRSGSYTRDAAKVRAEATACHLCGKPFDDPDDPPVADHLLPRLHGGSDELSNLRAAHRSCNGRKGQALGEGWG